jgi:hypothetical protein
MPPLNTFTRTCVAMCIAQMALTPVYAASTLVNTTSDVSAVDGLCTLREAVDSVNTTGGNEGQDGDCSGFNPIYFNLEAGATISLTQALPLEINVSMNLQQSQGNLTIDGMGNAGVFSINNSYVRLDNMTITGGSAASGGGVYADSSTLNLFNITVTDNSASSTAKNTGGGGIFARSSALSMTNSTVSGNSASSTEAYSGNGGGVYVDDSSLDIINSTLSGNSSYQGGGVYGLRSQISLVNSTVSGNSAVDYGSGITVTSGPSGPSLESPSSLLLTSSTLANNITTRGSGGGLLSYGSDLTLINSIVTGNNDFAGLGNIEIYSGGANPPVFSGVNLLGDSGKTSAAAFVGFNPISENIITATRDGTQPTASRRILSPLRNNGGSTKTHSLAENSPAIDAGDNTDCGPGMTIETDQRGELREPGACDIGSFEGAEDSTIFVVPLANGKTVGFSL